MFKQLKNVFQIAISNNIATPGMENVRKNSEMVKDAPRINTALAIVVTPEYVDQNIQTTILTWARALNPSSRMENNKEISLLKNFNDCDQDKIRDFFNDNVLVKHEQTIHIYNISNFA
jgi:hypothetical protein